MSTVQGKSKIWPTRQIAINLGYQPGTGTALVTEMARVHKLTPIEIGNAKCFDLDDIKVIATALGKTTEAFA